MRYVDKVVAEGSVAYGELGITKFVVAQGFGLGLVAQYDRPVADVIVDEHVRRTGEEPDPVRCDIETLREQAVLARPERLGSSPAGATRVVAPVAVPGYPSGCVGITAFGQVSNILPADTVSVWCEQVHNHAGRLARELTSLSRD